MTNGMYEIVSNRRIAQDTYEMVLQGDLSFAENPGQFVNIKLEGLYLRRPISICDWDDATLTLIYKVVGKGTQQLAGMKPGKELDLLCGLGNGFDMKKTGEHSLLIGGGVGVPPLYGLARRMVYEGKKVTAVLGFGTHVMENLSYDYYFACGPMPMLRAVHACGRPGQLSFEERMGCGFGACMGCSCETLVGNKRICVDGPVMDSSEVKF